MAPPALKVDDAQDPELWRKLVPALSIEGASAASPANLGEINRHLTDLKREGYVQIEGALPEDRVVPLKKAVITLFERKIPLPFLFVFDEPWLAFQSCAAFISATLGNKYRALPDFWVWHVVPSENATGWGPHRDRVQPTLERDNSPHSLTVWLAFTDATPHNGCIYVLPAHLDERFKRRVWDGEDNIVVHNPQDIRALPARAGSMLAWNQAVLHWGGRASRLGKEARISAAFEFQRGDKPAFNQPLLDPTVVPPFTRRLGLIGKQVLQYRHMYPLTDEVAAVAQALVDKYPPVSAAVG
jgi:hypothetical protein